MAIVDHVLTATTDRRGIDAQVGNWAVADGEVAYVDVTTPFLVDEAGDLAMDLDVFLQAGPPVMRPLYRLELPASMKRWLDPRHALLDLVGNLYKLDLDDWVEPIITATVGQVDPPLTVEEARAYYDGEVKTWTMLHRVLKGYDWWQRRVRWTTPNGFLPRPTTTRSPGRRSSSRGRDRPGWSGVWAGPVGQGTPSAPACRASETVSSRSNAVSSSTRWGCGHDVIVVGLSVVGTK